ncbi:phosphotransferase [Aggregicoccus sp. 17bor-14]|uniref:phosphotransferase family protein n=1 Tax=Myxococcaceae TaxID=31 RepID=UPI00129CEB8A|nr:MULTISPECIES: phosphotransferase [Myxococcaceae]MBF5045771.1 phosphotransferase [Simulacricoccus sp. 17bor-14]MRI91506.1 phosphotransferase [Aggregicoccus sp. 17bor-14]
MPLLPEVPSAAHYYQHLRHAAPYEAAVAELCARHGLPLDVPRRKYPAGNAIVFAVGEAHVVKLFAPPFAEGAHTEARVLAHVDGRLGVPTPTLRASGTLEGWPYLVMSQLPGVSLEEAWPRIPVAQREALLAQLGAALARLHALPPLDVPPPHGSWERFVRTQREGCVERQRSRGLADAWLLQIPGFLERTLAQPESAAPTALLHTEVMRAHTLVQADAAGRWTLSGLFDFEPAMQGHPDYELASVGVFLSGGEPALLRAFCEGYGWPDGALPRAVRRRALAFALLHRYSNLRWYLETVPPPPGCDTLEGLAEAWWGTE